jgi:hypothetical protein
LQGNKWQLRKKISNNKGEIAKTKKVRDNVLKTGKRMRRITGNGIKLQEQFGQ